MLVRVNGEALEISALTLGDLLRELDVEYQGVATALNENFVRMAERSQTALKDGDAIEIVSPRQGG
jgi:sulfur carrier protein